MACCLDTMYNSSSDHKNHPIIMSPRISFSNDFVDSKQMMMINKQERRDSSISSQQNSSDFEFSVTNYSMMSADELFSKGRLLPFKDNQNQKTTLRDELLAGNNDDENVTFRPPKSSTRWKGLLGLKRSNLGSKKSNKAEASANKTTSQQEFLGDGSSSCRDWDITRGSGF